MHKRDFLSELMAWCGLVTRATIFIKNRLHRKMTSILLFVISKHDKWEVGRATVNLDQSKTANRFYVITVVNLRGPSGNFATVGQRESKVCL